MKKSLQAYHTIVTMNRFGLFTLGLVLAVANAAPQSEYGVPSGCEVDYRKQWDTEYEDSFREECETIYV